MRFLRFENMDLWWTCMRVFVCTSVTAIIQVKYVYERSSSVYNVHLNLSKRTWSLGIAHIIKNIEITMQLRV